MKLVLATCTLACCQMATAGTVIRMQARDVLPEGSMDAELVIYVDGPSLRLDAGDTASGDEGTLIFHSDREEMIAIDHAVREFVVLDRDAVREMADHVSAAMLEAERALEELPPEQREFARQMLRQQLGEFTEMPAPREFRKADGSQTVAGVSCQDYDVFDGGAKAREICVADWSEISGGNEVRNVIKSMAAFFEDMRSEFSRDGFDLMGSRSDVFSHMRDIDGFLLRAADFDEAGSLTNETRYESSAAQPIDSAMFEPPAGYTEQVIR